MQNDPNEDEELLRTVAYQSAWIKANIAVELSLLEAVRIDGEGREAAKEKAARTVESVHRRLRLIEDRLKIADREMIQTRLAELESALMTI